MSQQFIQQISHIAEHCPRQEAMTWEGEPLPQSAVADPLGGLGVIAVAACKVCEDLNILPPSLTLQAHPEASFGYALTGLQPSEHGLGAFLLVLRDTAMTCSPEIELLLPEWQNYIQKHIEKTSPAAQQEQAPD